MLLLIPNKLKEINWLSVHRAFTQHSLNFLVGILLFLWLSSPCNAFWEKSNRVRNHGGYVQFEAGIRRNRGMYVKKKNAMKMVAYLSLLCCRKYFARTTKIKGNLQYSQKPTVCTYLHLTVFCLFPHCLYYCRYFIMNIHKNNLL